jgi:hypothetical protein
MLAATSGFAALAAAGPAAAEAPTPTTKRRDGTTEIKRSGSQPSGKGPADSFTGALRIDPLFQAPDPARVRGASVTFEPGAHGMAYRSPGSDPDRHIRPGMGAGLRRPSRGNPPRRRGLVSAGREALARRDGDDAYRHSGGVGWQDRRLDGARQRRTIPTGLDADCAMKQRDAETQAWKKRTGSFSPRSRVHGVWQRSQSPA